MSDKTMRNAALATVAGLAVVAAVVAGGPFPANAGGAPRVVLGSASYDAPQSSGFGTAHPTGIDNGGDPSGVVTHLTWEHWGAGRSIGHGRTYAFKPGGGYYAKPVRIRLRAEAIGDCADGTHGYTRLVYREALKPGAPLQKHWHPWGGAPGNIC